MKYSLKTAALGYEVPFLDVEDDSDGAISELMTKIADSYLPFMEIMKVSLELVSLSNCNQMLTFVLVCRYDSDSMPKRFIDSEWSKSLGLISEGIEEFLKTRDVVYLKIE